MSKKIEDLDLKEAVERTCIEPEFFEALVERDFKGISKFNVKGFLKILKREYDLDLEEFESEYNAYLNADKAQHSEVKESKVVTNVDQYSKESSTWWLWILIILVAAAIVFLVWKFDLFKAFVSENNAESASTQVVESVDNAANSVMKEGEIEPENSGEIESPSENSGVNSNAVNSGVNSNAVNSAVNSSTNSNSNANAVNSGTNSANSAVNSNGTNSANSAANSAANSQNKPINEILNSISQNEKKEAIFSTSGKVWVGFIDLATMTNSSIVTDENFSVDLSKDQLILVGGTALTLTDDKGEVQNFPAGNSKRFLVKDGIIKAISISEFRAYNGGKEW